MMNDNREFVPSRGRGRGPWAPRDSENWRSSELRRPEMDEGPPPRQGQQHRLLRRPIVGEHEPVQQRRPYSAPEGNTVLRRPHGHQALRESTTDPGGAGDSLPKSTLSVNAPEFFPSSYRAVPAPTTYTHPVNQENGGGDATMEAIALQHIMGVMRHLTRNPDMFDKTISPLVEAFESWLDDDVTIEVVMSALVEQSVEQPNFQYSGSKLCAILDRQYPVVFRKSLLNKCREEYGNVIHNLHLNPRRLQGYLLFIAELYKQIDLVEGTGKRIVALGNIILECIRTVIQSPTLENVKCVCQTLKLVGQHLDNQDTLAMNDIHQRLRELTANPTVSPNIQLLTSAACALRESNWGRDSVQPQTQQHTNNAPLWNDGPVFFGPDGKVLTREESQFLQESVDSYAGPEEPEDDSYGENEIWEHDEEMDEEIQAAFQQFLNMGKQPPTNR